MSALRRGSNVAIAFLSSRTEAVGYPQHQTRLVLFLKLRDDAKLYA